MTERVRREKLRRENNTLAVGIAVLKITVRATEGIEFKNIENQKYRNSE